MNSDVLSSSGSEDQEIGDEDNSYDDSDDMFIFQGKEKKEHQLEFILSSLKNHFIFYNLSATQLENVAKNMLFSIIPAQSEILIEAKKFKFFFIIEKGAMQVLRDDDKVKKKLKVGDSFGQLALLYKMKRKFILKTLEQCLVWGIDRQNFRKAVEEIILKDFQENKSIVDSVPFLSSLTLKQKQIIAGCFVIQRYQKGQSIFDEGQPGSLFYIIKSGQVSMQKQGKVLKTMKKFDSFGQKSLFYNTLRQVTATAEQKTVCLILGRDTLFQKLGNQIFEVTFCNFIKLALKKTKYLSKIESHKIDKIMRRMKVTSYKDGTTILSKEIDESFRSMKVGGKQKLIVVIEGSLKNLSINKIVAYESEVYGQNFLLQAHDGQGIQQQIAVENHSILAEIKIENARQIIGGFIDVVIHQQFISKREIVSDKMKNREKNIKNYGQMVFIRQLDSDFYGISILAGWQDARKKKHLLNVKFYRKSKIEDQSLYDNFQQEATWFKNLCHPFVVEIYQNFQDGAYLSSVYEFIRGQELCQAMRTIGLLSSSDARFYISNMILVLEYLCSEGIMLRDLSPMIFLVDDEGYLKLQSLVCSKMCKNGDAKQKTKTVIGTPHYTAPQVILNEGYNFTAALFSLGAILFQFLCGDVPFGYHTEDPLEIYQSIINDKINYPASLIDIYAQDLMDQLMNKYNPDSRLGGPSFKCLKENPWFSRINWEKLAAKQLHAPQFNRKMNVNKTVNELLDKYDTYQNLEQYLNEALPLRNIGEIKNEQQYWNWS